MTKDLKLHHFTYTWFNKTLF